MTDQTDTPAKPTRARKADAEVSAAAPVAAPVTSPLPPTVVPGTVTTLPNGLVLESF